MQAEIKGTTMPVLEITLEPGEQVISTHGELSWMTPDIQMSQHASGGGAAEGHGHLMQGLKRVLGGGGLFLTHYAAMNGTGMVTFAAKLPLAVSSAISCADSSQADDYFHLTVRGTSRI